MSFLSEHIAQETGQPEPVAGPNSPHSDADHHYKPEPAKNTGRVVMGPPAGGVVTQVNEHPELERQRAEAAAASDPFDAVTSGFGGSEDSK